MKHADLFVVAGTSVPILLLAMFASETHWAWWNRGPGRGRWRNRGLRVLAYGGMLVPPAIFAACMFALTFDVDWLALRVAVALFVTLMLIAVVYSASQRPYYGDRLPRR